MLHTPARGIDYDHSMHLLVARLCLDCEEIHEDPQCPLCASETFAYVSRWVPARESRPKPRTAPPSRMPTSKKAIGYGVVGLGLVGLAQWLAKGRKRVEDSALKNVGELK